MTFEAECECPVCTSIREVEELIGRRPRAPKLSEPAASTILTGERPLDLLVRMLQTNTEKAANDRLIDAYWRYSGRYPLRDRPVVVVRPGKGNA